MDKWIPSRNQKSGLLSRTLEFFIAELDELQDELDCPYEFICDFLVVIKSLWSPDSCHSKARLHKRDNPSSY
tara:strand:+ start:93 stop:308 length:216 start_codon:yes stop_codon:yes gene_type:complete